MHEGKAGCRFQERLVLPRKNLLFPFEFTEKAPAKPRFVEREPRKVSLLSQRSFVCNLAVKTVSLSKFDSARNLCPSCQTLGLFLSEWKLSGIGSLSFG